MSTSKYKLCCNYAAQSLLLVYMLLQSIYNNSTLSVLFLKCPISAVPQILPSKLGSFPTAI